MVYVLSAYTVTSFTCMLDFGVRGAARSEVAIKAATTNATVVKKPKTFWRRTRVECMVAGCEDGFVEDVVLSGHVVR